MASGPRPLAVSSRGSRNGAVIARPPVLRTERRRSLSRLEIIPLSENRGRQNRDWLVEPRPLSENAPGGAQGTTQRDCGGAMPTTTLYAWAVPAFIDESPVDHTWVTSYDNRKQGYPDIAAVIAAKQDYWYCWGDF